jgi:multidrug efflux pump subunit AcrA (membrane-fusion protein)
MKRTLPTIAISTGRPAKGFTATLVATAALAAVVAATGCGRNHGPVPGAGLPAAAVRVRMIESTQQTATEEVMGTVQAKLRATIEAKVPGRIGTMPVSLGQSVKEGDLLAQLDVREIQAKLDQAAAGRKQAERDYQRASALFAQQAMTQAEYDAAEARYHVAKAAVEEAESMLDYARVHAPFDGVITRKLADVGDLALPGKPLLEMETRWRCDSLPACPMRSVTGSNRARG